MADIANKIIHPARKALGRAALLCGFLSLSFALSIASPVHAEGDLGPVTFERPELDFTVSQDPTNPDYQIALKMMESLFKDKMPDFWDKKNNKWKAYPLIGLRRFDLNNDDNPELISYPVELVPEYEYVLCPKKVGCPYFIIQTDNKKARLIGLMAAHSIVTDDSYNRAGYRRIRAYTKILPDNPLYYELYEYNPGNKNYEMMKPN